MSVPRPPEVDLPCDSGLSQDCSMPVDLRVMSSTPDYHQMIDNSRINYVPIKLRCGVTAMCRTNVLILCPFVLQCLHKDILQCLEIMPRSVHALIKRTRIWVNVSYSYGQRDNPRLLRHTTAHHADWWLIWYCTLHGSVCVKIILLGLAILISFFFLNVHSTK
jgi:hypothetical protein